MTKEQIIEILRMRIAVYNVGVKAAMWKVINSTEAIDMMTYLFPKTGQMAYYILITEQMKVEHKMLTGGSYSLFKLPVQVEKEITEYLRKEKDVLNSLVTDCSEYLKSMDTIPTDHSLSAVNIGAFSVQNLDSLLRLCAAHYRFAFENKTQSYPYFE